MARVSNPRKAHNFYLIMNGVDQMEVQEVSFPDVSVDIVEHGDTNYLVKTPGLFKIGTLQFKKLKRISFTDNLFLKLLMFAQDPTLGGGLDPSLLGQDIILEDRDTSNNIPIGRLLFQNCWCSNVDRNAWTRMQSENIMDSATFQVEKVKILL